MSGIKRAIISTTNAPQPVGPYNQAVLVEKTLYLSGVLGLDKSTNKLVSGGVGAEAEQAFQNMEQILTAACSSFGNVVKTTVFLADIANFGEVNEIYKKHFKEPFPARSAFQVGKLPLGAQVEIEAIAVVGKVEDCN